MSFLAPLLEIQDLDLACDAARERAQTLAERELLPKLDAKRNLLAAQLESLRGERRACEAEEHELAAAVSQVVQEIESAEVERYSGKRMDRDQAAAHEASQQLLRDKQSEYEEQELALLEKIESLESRLAVGEAAYAAHCAELGRVSEAICKVDAEAEAEVSSLVGKREAVVARVPGAVFAAYERVRSQPRARGRGAARFDEGRCHGCRITLPSLERSRMLAEPEEALIQCPQCRRVLVR